MSFLDRAELLIGKEGIKKLENSKVIIFGCGGVGGYVAEMLTRSGVGNITLVDFDVIDITNINRQIIALHSNIGQNKVDVLKCRMLDINPNCNVTALCERYTKDSIILNNYYDYVIDAIDSVNDKVELIIKAHSNNLKIVSAMGAGNRSDVPEFKISNIDKTYNDGLAKIVRKKLRERGITKHNVVFSSSLPQSLGKTVGSISYYPAMCGCTISSFVINELLNK